MKWEHTLQLVVMLATTNSQVVPYEATSFPEKEGWERVGWMLAELILEDGFFVQAISSPGALDGYRKPIAEYAGELAFFIEWVVETDATESILEIHGTPAVLVVASNGASYHFTFTDQQVRFIRSTLFPEIYVSIAPNAPHTYRIELFGDEVYVWYIDGQLLDSGIPMGPIPNGDSRITWGSRYYVQQLPIQTTRWDYVRYGVIPEDGGGDFDSDGALTLTDFYFVHECLTNDRMGIIGGPMNNAGPGCRFADFDFDADTDLADVAAFQNQFEQAQ